MRKTKILVIAPYEGLREVLAAEAASHDDLEMDIYLGDLTDGAAIAKSLEKSGYDIILSRGGTATLIQRSSDLPVIDIAPTVYDVLRFVRMAQNIPGRFALVGFSSITQTADKIFELIQQKIEIVTLREASEAESVVRRLKDAGVSLIVGDAIATATAKRMQMNSILIASGVESVQSALAEAVRTRCIISSALQRNLQYRDILDNSDLSVVVFSADKKLLYSNISQEQVEYQRVFRPIQEYVETALKEGEFHITRHSKGYLFDITGKKSQQKGTGAIFYIRRRVSPPQMKPGAIQYDNMLDENYEEDYPPIDNVGKMSAVMDTAQRLGKSMSSICIIGGMGSPFDDVVQTLYRESSFCTRPMVTVDCALIDDKSFGWLLDSDDSPLYETHLTIHLKDFSSLADAMQLQFIQFVQSTSLHKRNRVIYSMRSMQNPNDAVVRFFNHCECAILRIPTLRERPEDIVSLANLNLSFFNIQFGRQVIGFDERAAALLVGYDWPGNNEQLSRLVKQCLVCSQSDTISQQQVQSALDEEKRVLSSDPLYDQRFTGTLQEITSQIVRAVFMEESKNRQKTADRLGISRSTLWRMLKE
jgi:transcriptional regulator with PAS, ATPase and Fis domain